MRHTLKPIWSWLLAVGLLALVLVLAALQYRWLDEVSRADREKTRDVLQSAVERFAEDFDREITRAFLTLQPISGFRSTLDDGVGRGYQRWQAFAPYPDLVRAVFIARPSENGKLGLARFDPLRVRFEAVSWPPELTGLRREMAGGPWPRRFGSEGFSFSFLADQVPALILPIISFSPPESGRRRDSSPASQAGRAPAMSADGAILVWLDLDTITEVILPELTERHLRLGDGTGYHVQIVAAEDRPIFRGGASMEGAVSEDGDAGTKLFSLLPPEKLAAAGFDPGWPRHDDDRRRGRPGSRFGEGPRLHRFYQFISRNETGRWRLLASHPAGSLAAAVMTAHRRNLTISFGILLLLATSLMLMLLATRRAQALAKQQLEFIAGVTHELMTPLAAMRSAGQNLADGVVEDPGQVKRYGRLVEDEGRRLSSMVEQVLEFAGMQAGRQTYSLRRTSLGEVLRGALAEYRPVLEEQGFEVETRIDEQLPEVMADASALRRAIQNLIANAVKYAAAGGWIGIRASAAVAGGRQLRVSIEDRGPGIAKADLPRLFEPFYRGNDGSREPIPGSGLGLSLVKQIIAGHGGRIEVATTAEGSKFTVYLPAAEDREDGDEV